MKLKYYLRGLGVGIVVTAVILTIANHLGNKMSDEDIIKRAAKLGMVMKEDESLFPPTEPGDHDTGTYKSVTCGTGYHGS